MGNVDGGAGKSAPLEYCDVGLGLKMQNTSTQPSSSSSYYPPNCTKKLISPYHHSTNSNESNIFMGGVGAGGEGGEYGGYGSYSSSGCGSQSGIFGAAAPTVPVSAVLQRTLLQSSGGGIAAAASSSASGGKVLFTATQWRELERQTTICKYMMASIPVPPQLLLNFPPFSTTTNPLSQSNTGGMDLRFSSGSDPEPWRCRRTDGKKWRCSRDVIPDQKYCERHAHKSRPRSRKHVEIHSSTSTTTSNAAYGNPRNNYTQNPPIISAYNTNQSVQSLQKPNSQFTNICSAPSYGQQPRSTEWFMKSGSIPVSTSTQQFQQLMQSSPGLGSKRDNNVSAFQQMYEDEPPMTYNPYLGHCTSDPTGSTETRHLFDAWSRGSGGEREELNGIGNKCSLTLSMQSGGNGIDDDNKNYSMGSHVGIMDSDRVGAGEILKSHNQWLNPAAWMGSAPGGPLGEALCLGIATSAKGGSNVPSTHGYSNSKTTSSSCEDGVHGLNFIR